VAGLVEFVFPFVIGMTPSLDVAASLGLAQILDAVE